MMSLPHSYFNMIEKRIFHIFFRAKFFVKWTELRTICKKKKNIFSLNNDIYPYYTRNVSLKSFDTLKFSFNYNINNYLIKKPFFHFFKEIYFFNLIKFFPIFYNNYNYFYFHRNIWFILILKIDDIAGTILDKKKEIDDNSLIKMKIYSCLKKKKIRTHKYMF